MNYSVETAPGQQRGWNLLEKIGEGDAGEVFRVESLLDQRQAILKRPSRSAFASDLIRQASQIQREAEILSALTIHESPASPIQVPILYDRSRSGTEFSQRFFIVISPASGFSLEQMRRSFHFQPQPGQSDAQQIFTPLRTTDTYYFNELLELGRLPNLLLLRLAAGLLEYLEKVHLTIYETPVGISNGIIWNDIKPDHIYWDPENLRFTLIDWGNAQFLESDGITKDRQYSRMGDLTQYVHEIGWLFKESYPEFFEKMNWPDEISLTNTYSEIVQLLKQLIDPHLQSELSESHAIRREETDLLRLSNPNLSDFSRLKQVQQGMARKGEMPNFSGTKDFFQKAASSLIRDGRIEPFIELINHVKKIPVLETDVQHLIERITELHLAGEIPNAVILSALQEDWAETHWLLRLAAVEKPNSEWWPEVSQELRNIELGVGTLQPLVAAKRLFQALTSINSGYQISTDLIELLAEYKSRLLDRWSQLEPDPPDSGIAYSDCEGILQRAAEFGPEATQSVFHALSQPILQAHNALDAWERQDFQTAQAALRRVLLWDPDRLRLIQADRALQTVQNWLDTVRDGVVRDEPLLDFITRQELIGRDLRNQVGAAAWLDALLTAFKQLRSGSDPTDVLLQFPESRANLDWLISLEPRRPLLASPGKTLKLERSQSPAIVYQTISGIHETSYGKRRSIHLHDPLDNWVPEARGSSARLFSAEIKAADRHSMHLALKLMRPNRADYALPLFREEAQVLSLMSDVHGVVRLIECGFLKIADQQLPPEDQTAAADIQGDARRYGLDSTHNFLADLESRVSDGWVPYLALEKIDSQANLLMKCDIGYTNGRFLPTLEGLIMAYQICEILETAHKRNIIYRDHKILHYYWLDDVNGITMIDWNIAKRYPQGLSDSEIQFDLVQFGARALHPILTGRAAQGALPAGPNKPEEIEAAARSYAVSWTYDDRRLPKDIKDLLAAVLGGEYSSARKLGEDIHQIYTKLSSLG